MRRAFLLFAALLAAVPALRAELDPRARREMARRFEADDGLGLVAAFAAFDKAVPAAERTAELERLWSSEEAARRPAVRASVLAYALSRPWEEGRRSLILRGAGDKSPLVRRTALHGLVRPEFTDARARVLAYLDDPDDPLREAALIHVSAWPDAQDVMARYAAAHRRDKTRARSVGKADFFLEKAQRKERK